MSMYPLSCSPKSIYSPSSSCCLYPLSISTLSCPYLLFSSRCPYPLSISTSSCPYLLSCSHCPYQLSISTSLCSYLLSMFSFKVSPLPRHSFSLYFCMTFNTCFFLEHTKRKGHAYLTCCTYDVLQSQ